LTAIPTDILVTLQEFLSGKPLSHTAKNPRAVSQTIENSAKSLGIIKNQIPNAMLPAIERRSVLSFMFNYTHLLIDASCLTPSVFDLLPLLMGLQKVAVIGQGK
jgi:hypothetical protein